MSIKKKNEPPYYENELTAKVYTGIVNQVGTAAPVVTVLRNELGGEVEWEYDNTGYYKGTCVGAFPAGKTWINLATGQGHFGLQIAVGRNSADEIYIEVRNNAGVDANTLLNDAALEVRVYE